MKQYIEKSVITEEIKRLIKSPILYKSEDVETRINILEYLLSSLDTLEVKEVDLEKEIEEYLSTYWPEEKELHPFLGHMALVLLILAGIIIFIKEVKNAPTFSDDYDFPFT